MILKVGSGFKGRVGLHDKLATTLENYQNGQNLLDSMYGRPLFG